MLRLAVPRFPYLDYDLITWYIAVSVLSRFHRVNAIVIVRMHTSGTSIHSHVQQVRVSNTYQVIVRVACAERALARQAKVRGSSPGLDMFRSIGINLSYATPTMQMKIDN